MSRLGVIMSPISGMGRFTIDLVREMGRMAIFFFNGCFHIFSYPFQIGKIINQVYFIGAKSIFIIALTGSFTGMVLGLQGYYTLIKFGSEGLVGAVVALTLLRELGPVLTAIMITGRAGSAIAAEIGIMRISEQIDALNTMNINPIRYLISPKFAAAFISFPILTAIFDTIGIVGGYLTGSLLLGVSPGFYFSRMEASVVMEDITGGFIKSFVFAGVVAGVCCYRGFYTHLRVDGFGAKGVSNATTSSVVLSSVLILVTDYIITSVLL